MKTVVVGASPKVYRYSYKAIRSLLKNNQTVIALGLRQGHAAGLEILDIKQEPEIKDVDTLTIYVSSPRLAGYEEYLLSLKPLRIIFNPGAENKEFELKAREKNIEVKNACTLVMLNAGMY